MPELDAERRERLAATIGRVRDPADHSPNCWDGSPCRYCTDLAAVLAPLVAGWMADDTAVCTTCQHRGGDDQPAQHPGCAAALARIEAAALREAAREAEERGDIGKDGGPEAWEWLRGLVQRAEIDREIGGAR